MIKLSCVLRSVVVVVVVGVAVVKVTVEVFTWWSSVAVDTFDAMAVLVVVVSVSSLRLLWPLFGGRSTTSVSLASMATLVESSLRLDLRSLPDTGSCDGDVVDLAGNVS